MMKISAPKNIMAQLSIRRVSHNLLTSLPGPERDFIRRPNTTVSGCSPYLGHVVVKQITNDIALNYNRTGRVMKTRG